MDIEPFLIQFISTSRNDNALPLSPDDSPDDSVFQKPDTNIDELKKYVAQIYNGYLEQYLQRYVSIQYC